MAVDRLTQDEAQARAAAVSGVHYALHLDLERGAKSFSGDVTISFTHGGGDTFLDVEITSNRGDCVSHVGLAREVAASTGRELAPGASTGIVRSVHICRDRSELATMTERFNRAIWADWYRPFGFLEGLRRPGEEGPVPGPGETVGQRLLDAGMIIGGTLDDVKRRIEGIVEAGIEYFVWHLPWGLVDDDALLGQVELFAEQVMPTFGMTVSHR